MSEFYPTTLYKAMKRPDGRVICLDPEFLTKTSRIVRTPEDQALSLSLGWRHSPQEAMALYELEEQEIGNAAAERAYDDRRMSEAAKAEAAAVEDASPQHLPEIPEAPKKRGRPKTRETS